MDERDELAALIYEDDPWTTLGPKGRLVPIAWSNLSRDDKDNYLPIADRILSAGYLRGQSTRG